MPGGGPGNVGNVYGPVSYARYLVRELCSVPRCSLWTLGIIEVNYLAAERCSDRHKGLQMYRTWYTFIVLPQCTKSSTAFNRENTNVGDDDVRWLYRKL